MISHPEAGNGWEIRRAFIEPELAVAIGHEALMLVGMETEVVRHFPRETDGAKGQIIHQVSAWDEKKYPGFPKTLYSHTELVDQFPNLIELDRRARGIVGDARDFQINEYEPGGRSRNHRDRTADDSFVLGLLGTAVLAIKDPVTHIRRVFDINPGDATYLVNPRLQRMRPLHRIFNAGNDTRISYVK